MLTGEGILVDLTNETVEKICSVVWKPEGASQGDPTPVLAIERLKLTVFYLKLFEQTSRLIPVMRTLG